MKRFRRPRCEWATLIRVGTRSQTSFRRVKKWWPYSTTNLPIATATTTQSLLNTMLRHRAHLWMQAARPPWVKCTDSYTTERKRLSSGAYLKSLPNQTKHRLLADFSKLSNQVVFSLPTPKQLSQTLSIVRNSTSIWSKMGQRKAIISGMKILRPNS